MSALPSPTSILLLLTLALPPRPALPSSAAGVLSTLSWPLSLLLQPPTSVLFAQLPTSSLRSIRIARAVEEYALGWVLLGLINASLRTYSRVKSRIRRARGRDGNPGAGGGAGLRTKKILGIRPLLTAAAWHLLAWRLVVLPGPSTAAAAKTPNWPFDPSTVIGLVGGLIASWGEMSRLLGLFGWNKDPQTGPSWTLATTHIVLTLHRLLLAIRILSGGISTAGTIKSMS